MHNLSKRNLTVVKVQIGENKVFSLIVPVEKNDTPKFEDSRELPLTHGLEPQSTPKGDESFTEVVDLESQAKKSQFSEKSFDTNSVALFSCEPQIYEDKKNIVNLVQAKRKVFC